MLYNDLDKIPLDIFIDVFTGDNSKLIIEGKHSNEELSEQAESLIIEYTEIIGGVSLLSEMSRKSSLINLHIKIEYMKVLEVMIANSDWDYEVKALSQLGFSYSSSEHDKIRKRISSILSMSQYMLERENAKEKPERASKMDKNYFARERVMVMSHFGMQIRKNEISAKEYAFMVKRMCEDMKSAR